MENWGLITYRETALLIDAKNSGLASKQRVAYVVAHECEALRSAAMFVLTRGAGWRISGSAIW